MLSVQNLTKYYKTTLAVDDLSFSVAGGEILGLLGPNGAGKTTVLRSITGIIQPNAGRIAVDGIAFSDNEDDAKRKMAFVPEVPNPYEMLTVSEHLRFIAMAYSTLDDFDSRCDELLQRFDLQEKKHELLANLSKGMKQKVAVCCAFIHQASVLLFDEPLIGIDPKGARELKDMIIGAKASGCSVLISTHMLDTAEKLCDRILIIQKGKKIAEGTLAELQDRAKMGDDATLEDLFLTLTEGSSEVEGTAVS